MAPDKRLRGKTPDPARRHKSPDAKALRKAELHVKSKKPSGGSAESASKETTRRALTFDETPKVHSIVAEHDAGDRRPGNSVAKPEPRKKAKGDRMSSSEADKILAKFVKDQDTW